ncbi:MAG TPA: YceI family protein [Solirubrobacteraceae bacterium]|nr:YceI family protein [Solirubrobacteraceae bacterium]
MTTTVEVFEGVYEADQAHSSFEAEVRHMGVGSFRTRFEDVTARLTAGRDGLRLQGRAAVESVAIRQPVEFREHVVYGADFFDARNHPHIAFNSDEMTLSEDGSVNLTGQLTIRGVSRPISATGTYRAPVQDPYGATRAGLDLNATVDRRDFGMNWQTELPNGGNVLEWDVALDVHLELVQR